MGSKNRDVLPESLIRRVWSVGIAEACVYRAIQANAT